MRERPETTHWIVRSFYCAVVGKMPKKFPWDDGVLRDLAVLDPTRRAYLDTEDKDTNTGMSHDKHIIFVSLANKFFPMVNQEDLKDEYQLLEDSQITLLDGEGKPIRVDHVWASILRMKTLMGEERFPNLKLTMTVPATQ
ncbi:hypothetical protein ScPMuIL_011738 [Solemya velum]